LRGEVKVREDFSENLCREFSDGSTVLGAGVLRAGVLDAGVLDVWFLGARFFVKRFVVLDQLLLEMLKVFVSGGVLRRWKKLGVSYL
jgi:hypothetical protein